ncbi:4-hydroxy-tetrahydrodipicolinate reductase [Ammoniphilus oxalaticus]|uniref:4-hydroxy-tetrahydrodipicolinate reductase n=1 Tax=Ammoniphilus oxalaticus TaxID=66863 RepID=A0A419SNE5_9BACL|nr:4-hydroxy-tetrahydrodipicolinate reductase [Ammoniphilus oxalaticus]RKD25741.1 4-hydroxy-tetrahydrodipicolinate reductase [Ammoniphilus oxalaticus]
MTIKVAIAGSKGKMGVEAVKMVHADEAFTLVAEIGRPGSVYTEENGAPYFGDVAEALEKTKPDVLVDLTTPQSAKENMETALRLGVRPVVGTTGFSAADIESLDKLCREKGVGAIIAPNFAIGAILMMKFAREAAKYMPHVEIIEMHHDQKLDAPSGTAIKTAEMIQETRPELKQGHPEEEEVIDGARGGVVNGFRIHSVRLPGLVAHQEVLFGHTGQTLSIRHDSINRESFMPGIRLAINKVMEIEGLVYGLDQIME